MKSPVDELKQIPTQTCEECKRPFAWPASSRRHPLCSAACREKWEEKNGPLSSYGNRP